MENMPDCVQTYSPGSTSDAPCDKILSRLILLSEELQVHGCPPLPELDTVDHEQLLDALTSSAFRLIGSYRALLEKKNQLDDNRRRILDDKNALATTVKNLKYDLRQTENTLLKAQQDRNEMRVNMAKAQTDVKMHRDEIRRLNSRIKSMLDQADHDRRKKEMELTKLRNQLHHTIGLPTAERRAVKKANRESALSPSRPPPEVAQHQALTALEANNKMLMQENRTLTGALTKLTSDLAALAEEFSDIMGEDANTEDPGGDQEDSESPEPGVSASQHLAVAGRHIATLSGLLQKIPESTE